MKLVCVLVGVRDSAFSVTIDESDTVDDLKDAIKAKQGLAFPASKLHLFLAKRGSEWLSSQDPDAAALVAGEISEGVKALLNEKLDLTLGIRDVKAKSGLPDPSAGQIHVLVDQQNEMASAGIPEDNGSTAAWLSAFLQTEISPDALPLVGQLADFIQAELPVKIGVHQSFLHKWSSGLAFERGDPQLLSKLFKTANSAPCMDLTYDLLHGVVNPRKPLVNTESTFHSFWDNLICSVVEIVLAGFGAGARDSNRSSSTGSSRPDFLFIVNSVCVFRGEEKAPGASIETPRRELCDKLIWSYGDVPYLFGYAAVGFKLSLYAIVYNNLTGQVDAIKLGAFNLDKLRERLRLLLAVLHISRLLRSIASLCPDSARDEYINLVRTNGVQVLLEPARVVKIFPDAAAFQKANEHLTQVYKILKDNQVPNVDRLICTDESASRMVFGPRGTDTKPKTVEDLFRALRDVLLALVKLHEASWMHRDIRWTNVIKSRDSSGSWFLIDFVDAAPSPQDKHTGQHLSQKDHAPEIHQNDQHSTAVDMWSVGRLIQTSGAVYESWFDLGERTEFVKLLMRADPSQRPTAATALEQLAQLEQEYTEQQQRKSSTSDKQFKAANHENDAEKKAQDGKASSSAPVHAATASAAAFRVGILGHELCVVARTLVQGAAAARGHADGVLRLRRMARVHAALRCAYATLSARTRASALFLMWAYLPEDTLEAYGFTYYPSKHWALAAPSMLVVTYLFSIVVYKACNLLSTPPLDAYATVLDSHSVFLHSSDSDDDKDNSFLRSRDRAFDADAATPAICDLPLFDVNSYMLDT